MRCGVVSSSVLFDRNLNPGLRLDASFGLCLGAIDQGRIDVLRACFKSLFTQERYGKVWAENFKRGKKRSVIC